MKTHNEWMIIALENARKSERLDEVPVGAVVVKDGELVAEGRNQMVSLNDPTAHAEIMALRAAGEILGNYRLTGCQLYVTLEPCSMCVGAMIHARIGELIYAASDLKTGAVNGAVNWLDAEHHNHKINVTQGVMAEESSAMLKNFFKQKRLNKP